MYDRTMRVGDLVVVTHKECMGDPDGRYFGILVLGPQWGAISVVCNGDGKKRIFDPLDWDVEVISASR